MVRHGAISIGASSSMAPTRNVCRDAPYSCATGTRAASWPPMQCGRVACPGTERSGVTGVVDRGAMRAVARISPAGNLCSRKDRRQVGGREWWGLGPVPAWLSGTWCVASDDGTPCHTARRAWLAGHSPGTLQATRNKKTPACANEREPASVSSGGSPLPCSEIRAYLSMLQRR